MSETYEVICEECDADFVAETDEGAVGWMCGHSIRTGHTDITREKIDGN